MHVTSDSLDLRESHFGGIARAVTCHRSIDNVVNSGYRLLDLMSNVVADIRQFVVGFF